MTRRNAFTAIAAGLLTCGLVAMAPASAQAQGSVLPEKNARITLAGCFTRETINGHDMYVLQSPTIGSPVSAPEAACPSTGSVEKIELKDVHALAHKHHLTPAMLGRWIAVSGRLATLDPGQIRKLHVMAYRALPAVGSPQASVLPEKAGRITLAGCFMEETIEGHREYVLRSPTIGSPASVPEENCAASTASAEKVELKDVHEKTHKHHLDRSMIGRWIEVGGRIEGQADKGELREVHVKYFRVLPVVVPRTAEAAPVFEPPAIAPSVAPLPELPSEQPVATTGTAEPLPKTASSVPLIGFIGLLSLAGGLMFRFLGRRGTQGLG